MLRKSIYFLTIIFIFSIFAGPGFVQAEENPYFGKKIRIIEIKGNKNVKEGTIREKIKLAKGNVYNRQNIDEDIKAINELGLFDEVKADVEEVKKGLKIIYSVVEKPIIKRIDFKGNKKFSNRRLKEKIESKENEAYHQVKIDADTEKLTSFYKDEGYSEVKVEAFPATDEKTNQVILTFFIREGKQVLVEKVDLVGVREFRPQKILKLLKTRRKKVYREDTLQKDLKEIETFYKNHGYLRVSVGQPEVTYNQEGTRATIQVKIDEGRKFKFGKISFQGNTVFTKKILVGTIGFKKEQIFSQDKLDRSLEAIHQLYYEKGYLRSQIEPEQTIQEVEGKLDIIFQITEGSIVFIDRIYIDGNTYTKDYVLRRELLVKEGDPFDFTRIRRSQEKLYNLGFLKEVTVDIEQTPVEDRADLVIAVKEDKPGILTMGAGYSSLDRFTGTVQVSHVNLFGRAQRLNLLWEFGQRKQNYEIGFTEPWLFSNPVYAESPLAILRWLNKNKTTSGFDIFDTTRIRQFATEANAYKEQRLGGDARLGRSFSDFISADFTYTYEKIKVFDSIVADVPPSDAVTSSLTGALARDSRDNVFDATRGSRNALSTQIAGGPFGGNVNFYRPSFSSSWFFPTLWKFVFSTNFRFGFIHSFPPSTEVPVYERFYLGGADTVRGYDYRGQIGPEEGGKIMGLFNIEYKFPIVAEKERTVMQGAFFYDLGGTWRNFQEMKFTTGREELNWKSGIGFGIRIFVMAVFPIRLDWGYGLNHRRDIPKASRHQFYFTIGQIF